MRSRWIWSTCWSASTTRARSTTGSSRPKPPCSTRPKRLTYRQFKQVVRRFQELADPDEHDKQSAKAEAERELHVSSTIDGKYRVDGWLDPERGGEITAELARLEQILFEQDWAEARARVGDGATEADLLRTAKQRRVDAWLEMCRRSANYDTDGPDPKGKAVINIHVDHTTWIDTIARLADASVPHEPDVEDWANRYCELDDRTPLHPLQMMNIALDAEIRVIIEHGAELHYGRTRRVFSGMLADAIRARDRECAMPGCGLPASRCQIDHITEWHDLGETNVDNGQCLCAFHNRWKHANPERFRRRMGPQ